jgi:hypothetical protein
MIADDRVDPASRAKRRPLVLEKVLDLHRKKDMTAVEAACNRTFTKRFFVTSAVHVRIL